MTIVRFNKRGLSAVLRTTARDIVNDIARRAATSIERDAPRDSNFLAETVEAIAIGDKGAASRDEQRVSHRSGETVQRHSEAAPDLPPDTAAVHVGADYAFDAELREPFIWPNVEAAGAELPGVVAKRRV